MCLHARVDRRSVVTARLDVTCTLRCSAVVVAVDHHADRFEAALEVGANGRRKDNQRVLLSRANAELRTRTNQQRTQIERRTRAIGRHKIEVHLDNLAARLDEQLDGGHSHTEVLGRALQTLSVLLDTEQAHLTIDTAVGFQTLESLLRVVEARRSDVHRNVFAIADLDFAPRAIAVHRANIVICFGV